MSDESSKPPSMSNKIINPYANYVGTKTRVKCNGDCLKEEKSSFHHGKVVNIFIAYEVDKSVNVGSYPVLENCLFGAVKLTKNIDIDLYKYFGYGFGFDRKGFFSIGDENDRKVIIFGVDMSSSSNTDNKKKYILTFGKVPK